MVAKTNVFLVGPMGAGKTTIGRLLATELGLNFKDTDKEIEDRSGVDIPWIFDKEGEEGFRDRESAVLDELTQMKGVLLATGGGIVQRDPNREVLVSRGKVVYLRTSVDEQVRRTEKDRKRPLLQGENPRNVLDNLMAARETLYRSIADVTVDTDGRSPKSVAQDLANTLSQVSINSESV